MCHSEEFSKTDHEYDFDNKVDLQEFYGEYTLERPLEKEFFSLEHHQLNYIFATNSIFATIILFRDKIKSELNQYHKKIK